MVKKRIMVVARTTESMKIIEMEPGQERTVSCRLDTVRVRAPVIDNNEEALKEWIWEHCKDSLLENLTIQYDDDDDDNTRPQQHIVPQPPKLDIAQSSQKRLDMLDSISKVQRQFFESESPAIVFGSLLDAMLDLMESEYGFIGEIKHEDNGTMYLQTHTITNIAWDEATRQFYENNIQSGLKFYNLNSLFGKVMTTKQAVISNDPSSDPRACGVPKGHPPLVHFLGIPFFKDGSVMNGMVGISNKPGGYTEADIKFLEPFTVTCSNLIQAYWQKEHNNYLINTLEQKVKERTLELELANESLAEANRRIIRSSQQQLEHFASMSHEIRTPLNCIIGTGSLLQQTQMTPMLEESVRMIVTSGDLLLSVVNDVLDYSKLESGHLDITLSKSSLQNTLSSVLHSIEMKTKNKQTLRADYDALLPEYIHMDSRRLQQILFNLLGNAVKFSHKGGVIEFNVRVVDSAFHDRAGSVSSTALSTRTDVTANEEEEDHSSHSAENNHRDPKDEVSRCPFHKSPTAGEVSVEPSSTKSSGTDDEGAPSRCPFSRKGPGEPSKSTSCSSVSENDERKRAIRFEIKDYGQGISKADFESIFHPFHQTRSGKAENVYGGTGLGLAITKKLVHGLGGTISVDSVEGEWSRFTVDLPLLDDPADTTEFSSKLQHVSVFLVLGFYEHEEEHALRVCKAFHVDVTSFPSMSVMEAAVLNDDTKKERSYVCVVHEEMYNETSHRALVLRGNITLVTVGGKYVIHRSDAAHHHMRSLEQMIPCALMKSILNLSTGKSPKEAWTRSDSEPVHQDVDKLQILLAEDNLVNQKVMMRMLNRIGAKHVDIVSNGAEAVESEAAKPYDLILMDMQMPIMDGLAATRKICSRQGGHPIPKVVFVTAHVSDDFEEQCRNAGGSGFLPKPFKVNEIAKCLHEVCLEARDSSSAVPSSD